VLTVVKPPKRSKEELKKIVDDWEAGESDRLKEVELNREAYTQFCKSSNNDLKDGEWVVFLELKLAGRGQTWDQAIDQANPDRPHFSVQHFFPNTNIPRPPVPMLMGRVIR